MLIGIKNSGELIMKNIDKSLLKNYSKEDIEKVINFFSKSKEHIENERLIAEFDEQRLVDLNMLS